MNGITINTIHKIFELIYLKPQGIDRGEKNKLFLCFEGIPTKWKVVRILTSVRSI